MSKMPASRWAVRRIRIKLYALSKAILDNLAPVMVFQFLGAVGAVESPLTRVESLQERVTLPGPRRSPLSVVRTPYPQL